MLIFLSCLFAVCFFTECFFAVCLSFLAAFLLYAFLLNAYVLYAFLLNAFLLIAFLQHNRRKLQKKLENEIIQHFTISIKLCITSFYFCFLLDACHFFYNCNDHGTCKNDGSCQCDPGFYANDCSGKFTKAIYDWEWYLLLVLNQVSQFC